MPTDQPEGPERPLNLLPMYDRWIQEAESRNMQMTCFTPAELRIMRSALADSRKLATELEQHLQDALLREGKIAVERNELREQRDRALAWLESEEALDVIRRTLRGLPVDLAVRLRREAEYVAQRVQQALLAVRQDPEREPEPGERG